MTQYKRLFLAVGGFSDLCHGWLSLCHWYCQGRSICANRVYKKLFWARNFSRCCTWECQKALLANCIKQLIGEKSTATSIEKDQLLKIMVLGFAWLILVMKKVGGWRSSNGRRRVAVSLRKHHSSAKATLIRVSGKLRGLMNGSGRDGAMEIPFNLNSCTHSKRQN